MSPPTLMSPFIPNSPAFAQPNRIPVNPRFGDLPRWAALWVNRGLYNHFALYWGQDEHGMPWVVSVKPGQGVVYEPVWMFSQNSPIYWDTSLAPRLSPDVIECRVSLAELDWRYHWTEANCDQFVRYALGLPVTSPQANRFWLAVAAGVLVVASNAAA